jgi:hypothetical protein
MLVTLSPTSYSPHMTRPTALCAETADTRHVSGIAAVLFQPKGKQAGTQLGKNVTTPTHPRTHIPCIPYHLDSSDTTMHLLTTCARCGMTAVRPTLSVPFHCVAQQVKSTALERVDYPTATKPCPPLAHLHQEQRTTSEGPAQQRPPWI